MEIFKVFKYSKKMCVGGGGGGGGGEGKLHSLYDCINQSTRLLIKKKFTILMIPESEIVIHVEMFETLFNRMVEMKHIIIDDVL